MTDQSVQPSDQMDDHRSRRRLPPLSQRIHEGFTDLCADLARPLPTIPHFIPPDNVTPTEAAIRLLVRQVRRRGLRPGNSRRMTDLFVLGRALHNLESRQALRWLQALMTPPSAYRLFRTALRCHELFSTRGVDYLAVVSSITPNVLAAMLLSDYESLLSYAMLLAADLQEQVS